MSSYPPNNQREILSLLNKLGFVEKKRIGKGKHQYKFYHPSRRNMCEAERPFIIVPHKIYKTISENIMKKIMCYNFSVEEIKEACKRG